VDDWENNRPPGDILQGDEKGGEITLAVSDRELKWRRSSGENFIGWDKVRIQLFYVVHSGQSGNGHKSQKCRYHKKEKVVSGIYRRKAYQEGNYNVERPGFADLQTKGNAMSAMIVRNTPPLSEVDISLFMTSLWQHTATALFLTSSGAT